VSELPDDLKPHFSDDVGNAPAHYGGFLQLKDVDVLPILNVQGLFACFRLVFPEILERLAVRPPTETYTALERNLQPMGWDIASGNGWLSASSHGCYPIDPFTGDSLDDHVREVNSFALFDSLADCEAFCDKNNVAIPEHAPWFPVLVCVDSWTHNRFRPIVDGPHTSP
jgi:hypothetical protein